MKRVSTLVSVLLLAAIPVARAEFQLVKNFETGGTTGISFATNPIVAEGGTGSIEVVDDPFKAGNKVLKLNPGTFANGTATNNDWFYFPIPTNVSGKATIYGRFAKAGEIVDIVWGTSSVADPLSYGDFSSIARVELDGILDYHDGSYTEVTNGATVASVWYEYWIVLNQPANTYDIWIKGGPATATKVVTGADYRLNSNDPQNRFVARMTTGDLVTPKATDATLWDDIYVDISGENVTTPGSGGSSGGGPVDLGTGRIVNIATRGQVGTGASLLIGGFVVEEGSRRVLIRGVGPTLGGFGVSGTLADPVISLFKSGETTALATNDNWGDASNAADISATAASSGAFALGAGSADAAILMTLEAGAYTVQVSGKNDTTGLAIVEVYQAK